MKLYLLSSKAEMVIAGEQCIVNGGLQQMIHAVKISDSFFLYTSLSPDA